MAENKQYRISIEGQLILVSELKKLIGQVLGHKEELSILNQDQSKEYQDNEKIPIHTQVLVERKQNSLNTNYSNGKFLKCDKCQGSNPSKIQCCQKKICRNCKEEFKRAGKCYFCHLTQQQSDRQMQIKSEKLRKIKENLNLPSEKEYLSYLENARFFFIRSCNQENITFALEHSVWATTQKNEKILFDAYRKTQNIILIFGVNKTNHFQGVARMHQIFNEKQNIKTPWKNTETIKLGEDFLIKWLRVEDLNHQNCSDLKNAFCGNEPLTYKPKDCQEVDYENGRKLCLKFSVSEFENTYVGPGGNYNQSDWSSGLNNNKVYAGNNINGNNISQFSSNGQQNGMMQQQNGMNIPNQGLSLQQQQAMSQPSPQQGFPSQNNLNTQVPSHLVSSFGTQNQLEDQNKMNPNYGNDMNTMNNMQQIGSSIKIQDKDSETSMVSEHIRQYNQSIELSEDDYYMIIEDLQSFRKQSNQQQTAPSSLDGHSAQDETDSILDKVKSSLNEIMEEENEEKNQSNYNNQFEEEEQQQQQQRQDEEIQQETNFEENNMKDNQQDFEDEGNKDYQSQTIQNENGNGNSNNNEQGSGSSLGYNKRQRIREDDLSDDDDEYDYNNNNNRDNNNNNQQNDDEEGNSLRNSDNQRDNKSNSSQNSINKLNSSEQIEKDDNKPSDDPKSKSISTTSTIGGVSKARIPPRAAPTPMFSSMLNPLAMNPMMRPFNMMGMMPFGGMNMPMMNPQFNKPNTYGMGDGKLNLLGPQQLPNRGGMMGGGYGHNMPNPKFNKNINNNNNNNNNNNMNNNQDNDQEQSDNNNTTNDNSNKNNSNSNYNQNKNDYNDNDQQNDDGDSQHNPQHQDTENQQQDSLSGGDDNRNEEYSNNRGKRNNYNNNNSNNNNNNNNNNNGNNNNNNNKQNYRGNQNTNRSNSNQNNSNRNRNNDNNHQNNNNYDSQGNNNNNNNGSNSNYNNYNNNNNNNSNNRSKSNMSTNKKNNNSNNNNSNNNGNNNNSNSNQGSSSNNSKSNNNNNNNSSSNYNSRSYNKNNSNNNGNNNNNGSSYNNNRYNNNNSSGSNNNNNYQDSDYQDNSSYNNDRSYNDNDNNKRDRNQDRSRNRTKDDKRSRDGNNNNNSSSNSNYNNNSSSNHNYKRDRDRDRSLSSNSNSFRNKKRGSQSPNRRKDRK